MHLCICNVVFVISEQKVWPRCSSPQKRPMWVLSRSITTRFCGERRKISTFLLKNNNNNNKNALFGAIAEHMQQRCRQVLFSARQYWYFFLYCHKKIFIRSIILIRSSRHYDTKVVSMHSMLGKISARQHIEIFFLFRLRRQFAWNAKSYFPGQIRTKHHEFVVCWICPKW